jgi:putative ABC transport system permease protein
MPQKMQFLTYILAGLRHRPGRNLATFFCFALIAANIFTGQFLIAGAAGGVDRGVTRMGADQLVVPSQYMAFLQGAGPDNTIAVVMAEPSEYRIKSSIMEKIGNIEGVSVMSPQLYVSTLNLPELSPQPVYLYGIDPETDFTIRPWLQEPLDQALKPGDVLVGHEIAGEIHGRISAGSRSYSIAGRLDPTRSSIDHTVFMGMDDAYALAAMPGIVPASGSPIMPGDINAVLIQDTPGVDRDSVVVRIRRLFTISPEYKYVSVIGRHFTLDPVAEDIRAIPGFLNIISVFMVIVALPLIALIAAMVAHERQREIGLLKSMGAKRKTVFLLVIAESLVLATAGGIAGAGASLVALFLMNAGGILNSAFQVSFRMPSLAETGLMAGLALLIVIAIGSISSLLPAYQCSTMKPYDAIRGEGQ